MPDRGTTCQQCGQKLEGGAAFCDECGTKQPQYMYCEKCGEKLEGGSVFCDACGTATSNYKPVRKKPRKPGSLGLLDELLADLD